MTTPSLTFLSIATNEHKSQNTNCNESSTFFKVVPVLYESEALDDRELRRIRSTAIESNRCRTLYAEAIEAAHDELAHHAEAIEAARDELTHHAEAIEAARDDLTHLPALRDMVLSCKDYEYIHTIDLKAFQDETQFDNLDQIKKFKVFISWMDKHRKSKEHTKIDEFVQCLYQNTIKIRILINNAKTFKLFIFGCNRLLHDSRNNHVFFILGAFTWDPIFSTTDTTTLGKVDAIADNAQEPRASSDSFSHTVDMSPLTGLRVVGKEAFVSSIGDVSFEGCSKLHTIGQDAFYDAAGNVNLSGCTSLKVIDANAFNSSIGLVDLTTLTNLEDINGGAFFHARGVIFKGCTALKSIGEYAFHSVLEGVDLSGCAELQTIGANAFMNAWSGFQDIEDEVNLSGCTSLQVIHDDAFKRFRGVADLTNLGNLKEVKRGAFYNARSVIFTGCTTLWNIEVNAFQNVRQQLNLEGCTGLQNIGEDAFYILGVIEKAVWTIERSGDPPKFQLTQKPLT